MFSLYHLLRDGEQAAAAPVLGDHPSEFTVLRGLSPYPDLLQSMAWPKLQSAHCFLTLHGLCTHQRALHHLTVLLPSPAVTFEFLLLLIPHMKERGKVQHRNRAHGPGASYGDRW